MMTEQQLFQVAELVREIYGKIGVDVTVIVDSADFTIPTDYGSYEEVRAWLYNHRDKEEIIGLGRGGVHALLGGRILIPAPVVAACLTAKVGEKSIRTWLAAGPCPTVGSAATIA